MTFRTLIGRSLRFHWRSHLGVTIGAAIGSAALVGALVVGDSVKGSLKEKALERLGKVSVALSSPDRLFRARLAADLGAPDFDADSRPASVAPVLLLQGAATRTDASATANQVSVIGFEPDSWAAMSGAVLPAIGPGEDEVVLNENLRTHLDASIGDMILLRIPKASALSQEAVLAPREDATVSLRLRVAGVMDKQLLGNFSLHNAQAGPRNAFVNLKALQRVSGRAANANTLLAVSNARPSQQDRSDFSLQLVLEKALEVHWQFEDLECELATRTNGCIELRTSRVFLDPPVEQAALTADINAQPLLTYIANLIQSGTNAAPYSMVTAAGAPWTPPDMMDDELVLNQWLADDLQAGPGDAVTLIYYDPESGASLTERTNTFRVHSIVPMEMPWADRTLMPDFPGIEEAESTADWDTAFPLTHTIRPKDDDYWQQHRGTPKAFLTLAAGQMMWANRFGKVTGVRFPAPTHDGEGTRSAAAQTNEDGQATERIAAIDSFRSGLGERILFMLDPAELGLRFEPVREQALKAAEESQDFGGLFVGFSLFLIAAALILMTLLFQFGLEQRSAEVGTLLALGFTHKQVRRLLLGEGAALAFIGGVIGMLGGVFYAKAMLLGLTTVWKDAVGATTLHFFVTPGSLAIGLLASSLVAVFTIWLALRKQAKRPAIALLTSGMGDGRWEMASGGRTCERVEGETAGGRTGVRIFTNAATVATASLVSAAGLVGWALIAGEISNAGVFFGAGALVLLGGLALISARLQRSASGPSADRSKPDQEGCRDDGVTFSSTHLSLRGLARRRSRSVATAALLACGSFLILSIGVFRLDANRDATERDAGTGGFALIGESTLPIVQDLNSPSSLEFFALDEQETAGVEFVQFRVRAGDDASCLNLNRAQKPRLLGVDPAALEGRFTFAKVAGGLDSNAGWRLLDSEIGNRKSEMAELPAVGDLNSILWAMGKKVGDTIDYMDGRGRLFKVRIVGAVANSILQGNLVIDAAAFVQRFPGESGYQYFLMDAPTNRIDDVSATLSRAVQDYGLEITPAARRLNQFNAVQNTYLGTFQILGGLGLLLGSAGLGIVVLRNVLERRGELAVLMAVGFRRHRVERLVLLEHSALLGIGLAIGLVAAVVAVLPTLISPGSPFPYTTLVPTLLAVLANGLIWTWAATRLAMRGNLLEALRNE